jgi:2-oxoglutarate ferredoxin oxidoreductase subunit gamma
MTQKRRGEVIFSGIGGGGVLLAGECTARAATKAYEHVVWFPNYGAAVRGGPCECFVIFSDEPIASPVLSQVQTVVVLDPAQLKASEKRVRPGGKLIVESTGLSENAERKDITVIKVAALEQARASGNPKGANFILLGRYIGTTNLISPALVEKDLEARFGGNKEALASNLLAFRQGLGSVTATGS